MALKRRNDVYVVILVGGKGKRLRPLSTDLRPKAFLSVAKNRRTMFGNTVRRALKLVAPERIIVVANEKHRALVKKDLPKGSWKNILLEPVSRNTAPAIALAVQHVLSRDKDASVLVMPADHYVLDPKKEEKCLRSGIGLLKKNGNAMVAIGIKPDHPSTEYGYIKVSKPGYISKARAFTEKPDIDTAAGYVASGNHLWNAGIFIFNAGEFIRSLDKYAPKIFRALSGGDIRKSYGSMPDISVDYAIMEKTRNLYCVKGSYGWSDVGSFDTLKKVLKRESRRFVEKSGKVVKII